MWMWKKNQPMPQPITDPWEWYIYLHEWLIFMVNVGKYTIPMDPMGSWFGKWCWQKPTLICKIFAKPAINSLIFFRLPHIFLIHILTIYIYNKSFQCKKKSAFLSFSLPSLIVIFHDAIPVAVPNHLRMFRSSPCPVDRSAKGAKTMRIRWRTM